ncbi:hypothetical protein Pdw03_8143 [Penicillium digitatum]|uniref:Uncharacterized protein n=1 Tax=Penicillium digitatum TaxID=36651 RepID=A0A7T7BLJ6_PENDI|nr:hypothetical protein Pdw03_8143 [Penicillium digitatum]
MFSQPGLGCMSVPHRLCITIESLHIERKQKITKDKTSTSPPTKSRDTKRQNHSSSQTNYTCIHARNPNGHLTVTSHPHSSPQHPTTHVTYFDNALENKIMDAQLPTTGSQPNQKLRLGSEIQGFGPRSTSDAHSHSGWSIRRLLSRRGGRKYSVLERESNRLRKRMGS